MSQREAISALGIIADFYSHPVKLGDDQSEHSIDAVSLRREEVEYLASLVSLYKPVNTLEIGLALASSTVAIMGTKLEYEKSETHIALDPFQELHARNAGLREVNRLGLSESLNHIPRFSEDYLNECFLAGKKFDFIFIDGKHTIGQAVADAFLSDKVMNRNGIIAIHDSLLFSTAASVKYLLFERGYKMISARRFNVKTMLRMVKYLSTLGWFYAVNVVPRINTSIIALQKCD